MSTKNREIAPLEQGGLRENRLGQAGGSTQGDWDAIDAFVLDAERTESKLAPHYRETVLPDGMPIIAHFVRAEHLKYNRRWIAHFLIADQPEMEEFAGLPIICGWNAPEPGKRVSPSHNLGRDYKAVTGRRVLVVPRNHGPSAVLGSFLKGVLVEAVTKVVARRMDQGTKQWAVTDADEHYSVIDRIVRRTAGTPRVLQRRTSKDSSSNGSS